MKSLIDGATEALKSGHITFADSHTNDQTWWHHQFTMNLYSRLEQYKKGIELKDVIL